ncbi:MAG: hypothetical protein EOP51_13830, partial [Sphingobacteriales bacterium]
MLSWGQMTIYSTNFGTTTTTVNTLAGWTTSGAQAANLTLSTTSASSTYTTPISFSAGANLADGSISSTAGTAVANLAGQVNTTGYTSIELAFGYRASSSSYTASVSLEWSTNGTLWNTVTLPTLVRNGNWGATNFISLPTGAENQSNLRFRFTLVRTNTSGNFRIDDFTVRGVPPPCSGTPAPGNTSAATNPVTGGGSTLLSLSGTLAGSGFTYQWQSSQDNLTYADIGLATASTYTANPTMRTWYRCLVTCSNSGANATSTPVEITLIPCISNPTSNDGSGITSVTMGSATFPVSDVTQYTYTGSIPNLTQGSPVTSSITFATGQTYDSHIWIDFNDDGIFNNTNEKVYTGVSLATNPTTLNTLFTLSGTAALGQHKMRIGTADFGQATPTPCYSSTWGVTIDLDVNIIASSPTITPTPTTLTGFTYSSGSGPSAAQSFNLAASGLTPGGGNITISESANYEVSTTSATTGFGASATLGYTGTGSLASNTVWVRLKAGRAIANYNGETISISGGGATSSVTVSGNVTVAVFTSVNPGPWTTASTWDLNAVPTASDNVVINTAVTLPTSVTRNTGTATTINAGHSLAVGATYTNNGTTTVNGTFQVDYNGYANGSNLAYASTGSYLVFNTGLSAGTYNITAGQTYWPVANAPENVQVNTNSIVNLNDGARTIRNTGHLKLNGGFVNTAGITINGDLLMEAGGSVTAGSPVYGTSSTLHYRSAGTYGRGLEWSATTGTVGTTPGYPNNILVTNGTTLNVPNTGGGAFGANLLIGGNLTINSSSAFYMDFGGNGNKAGSVTVGGNISIDGNISLGNAIGGDMFVRGNWVYVGGSFNHNNRMVSFNGTLAQSITGSTGFGYLRINNSNGVTLAGTASNTSVNNELYFEAGKLTLGANNIRLLPGATASNADVNRYAVTNSTGRFVRNNVGNTATSFPIGLAATYTPVTVTNSGTVNNISALVSFPITNAVAEPNNVVTHEWNVLSEGAGANAVLTFQWNTANQGSGFAIGPNHIAQYQTAYNVITSASSAGSGPYSITSSGHALPVTAPNLYVVGNVCAITRPAQPSVITGTTPVSVPSLGVAYSVTNVPGVTYTWSYGGTGATINNNGNNAITIDFAAGATGGTLSVVASVGTCSSAVRTYVIAIAPPNDLCANASALTVNGGAVSGTMVNASTTPAIDSYTDVWYQFTPDCIGKYTISVGGFTGDLDVSYFTSCASTSPVQSSNTTANPEILVTSSSLSASTTYYIRVRAFNPSVSTSTFNITVSNQMTIFTHPSNQTAVSGSPAIFSSSMPANATAYQWQVSTDNGVSWSNVTGGSTNATGNQYTTVATTLAMNGYKYRVIISNGTCNTVTSNGLATLTVNACVPSSTSSSDYINSFSTSGGITNISNTSSGYSTGGYGNFYTTHSASQNAGGILSFSETHVGTGMHGLKIWVDWNNDGDFTGVGEEMFSASAPNGTQTFSGNINIPTGALGDYRMRLVLDYNNTSPTPCQSMSWGEGEDYKLTVTAACVTPVTPTTPTSNSPQCLPAGVTISKAAAPAGETWYWQTTANGTATAAINSAATYTVTTPGVTTIYLRSRNNTTLCWSAASSISVTVNEATSITTQPANQIVFVGTTATFSVVATGTALSYQWQVDKGSGFVNVVLADGTGGTTASVTTVSTTMAMTGYKYRVIITGTCGNVTSDGLAILTVSSTPLCSSIWEENFDYGCEDVSDISDISVRYRVI